MITKRFVLTSLMSIILSCSAFANEHLQSINWDDELRQNCKNIWSQISEHVDTNLSSFIVLHCTRCALKNNNPNIAMDYLKLAKQKGGSNPFIIQILESRILAAMGQDSLAVTLLTNLSYKINLVNIFKLPEIKALTERNVSAAKLQFETQPKLDLFTFFISAISFIGILYSGVLIFVKNKKHNFQKWLASLILVNVLILLSYVMYWSKYEAIFPYLKGVWQSLYFLIGPFLYFYMSGLFDKRISVIEKIAHCIPFLIIAVLTYYGGHYYVSPIISQHQTLSIILSMLPKILHLSLYLFLILKLVSGDWNIDKRIVEWKHWVIGFYTLFLLANIAYYALSFWNGFNTDWDYFISAVMATGIIGIAVMGFIEPQYLRFDANIRMNETNTDKKMKSAHVLNDLQEEPFFLISDKPIKMEKYASSTLTQGASLSIKQKLEQLLAEKQIYLNNELRVNDVAEVLQVSRHNLSQVINENYGMGFFDLMNKYRVHHAVGILSRANNPSTISEVAYQSGFNNKVSFYKAFRVYFNCTPLEYLAKQEQQRVLYS